MRVWATFIWLRIGEPVAISSEHGNEISVYKKPRKYLNQLSDYKLLAKEYVPTSKLQHTHNFIITRYRRFWNEK
jgi:hypothetical protein